MRKAGWHAAKGQRFDTNQSPTCNYGKECEWCFIEWETLSLIMIQAAITWDWVDQCFSQMPRDHFLRARERSCDLVQAHCSVFRRWLVNIELVHLNKQASLSLLSGELVLSQMKVLRRVQQPPPQSLSLCVGVGKYGWCSIIPFYQHMLGLSQCEHALLTLINLKSVFPSSLCSPDIFLISLFCECNPMPELLSVGPRWPELDKIGTCRGNGVCDPVGLSHTVCVSACVRLHLHKSVCVQWCMKTQTFQ